MRIRQFKDKVGDIAFQHNVDLEVTEDEFDFCIECGARTVATVSKSRRYLIDTGYVGFGELLEKLRQDLLDVLYELASTPLNERKDVKRYMLKHRFLGSTFMNYLTYHANNGRLTLSMDTSSGLKQTQFTQEEIEEIKKKYSTDLSDFKQIEVTW